MNYKKTYRVAILGCGKVAHLHARAIRNLEGAEMPAVWSRSPSSAEAFAREYGAQPCEDIGRMIRENRIDLAIVCTPHPFHREPAVAAAEAGANVLVEKPLASSLEDCDAMIRACDEAGVRLGVVSQRRFYAPVQRIRKAIDDGKLGSPVLGTVTMLGWRDQKYYEADPWRGTWEMEGGGVLVNQAPHQLDILLWFMGEAEEVYGTWKNLNHPYIEVEDTALATVKFKNGGLGNIILSNAQKPGIYCKVHVHGENGASAGVQTDGGAMFVAGMSQILDAPVNDLWTVPDEEKMLETWRKKDEDFFSRIDPMVYYMERQIDDFILALETGSQPLIDGRQGRRTVELFTAVYRSAATNRPVKFPLGPS